jgi:2-polyprenyl-3-methyl-5-hydroxy-6-metoxy-1,4-benzoquinol methylase
MKCRICGGTQLRPTGLKTCEDWQGMGNYGVYRCSNCANYVTEPMLREAEDFKLPTDQKPPSGLQRKMLESFMRSRVQRIRALIPSSISRPKILDVGGGACAFGNAAAQENFEVTILDPNPANQVFANIKSGVRFLPNLLDLALVQSQVIAHGSLDAITLWHSLEHIPVPAPVLAHAKALLKPGGVLFVSVPDIESPQARLGGNYWTYLDVPHHLSHFTRPGLERVMAEAGFETVRVFPFSLEYDVFGWFQTLLNVASRSHNYFYNRAKKGRVDASGFRHPRWTRAVNAAAPLFLPAAACAFALATAVGHPSCIEAAYRIKDST